MGPFFAKRLKCFYCGCRSPQADREPIRKWRCQHCEAINYLDENGEITDPPASETNPASQNPSASTLPFELNDFTSSSLFCDQCLRNQHLFTNNLASYFPPTDDPSFSAYEREYPKFRKNLEERYPQVCATCEPRVKQRIRETGYEAKADHLRRMMDRSKAGRMARNARRWNWRSLLVWAGAMGYWASVAGQLSWDIWSALAVEEVEPLQDPDAPSVFPDVAPCAREIVQTRRIPSYCAMDLAPYAGLALIVGILSLWWNPKLRLKVEGRGGRFAGLGEYYQVQLIVMVVRCAFWAVLRDPSSSGLNANISPTLHLFMFFFTILSVAISRRIVRYDTRPLVVWNDDTPTATPSRKTEATSAITTGNMTGTSRRRFASPQSDLRQPSSRFPLDKLASPRANPEGPSIPTPPPVADDMDWTPSVVQHELTPTFSVRQRDKKSVVNGKVPMYGFVPAAPGSPAWNLRIQPQRPTLNENVGERNPFQHTPAQTQSWQRATSDADTAFAPPRFFPLSDHTATTGLESLFDRTFTIRSPEDTDDNDWQTHNQTPNDRSRQSMSLWGYFVYQYLRLGLLLVSLAVWTLSGYGIISLQGNYVEIASLGSASLIAGFALLEVMKHPIMQWNGIEILVCFAELLAAIHLGGHLPQVAYPRQYFDKYGKLLLVFMTVQEALNLFSLYQLAMINGSRHQQREQQLQTVASRDGRASEHQSPSALNHQSQLRSFNSQPPAPALSFSSTVPTSSFSAHSPAAPNQSAPSPYDGEFSENHSFTLNSLKENESDVSDAFDRDSDTETTITTATSATNTTIRNIRYGRNNHFDGGSLFSPRRSELGPGIGSLSLEDEPGRRITRSQSKLKDRFAAARGIR
ncbi:uncharacterized protein BP01DRAFT_338427 [Aspergillus saccharolyticus JOP 1030-1]|uniref:Ima1 N-terminal domain-containing protein n=1 Tax=Aspergillus saccharolyticus JOP 1030-1 TaxID=1450539 RepID=A0A318ZH73_9EURO|nr:hypothetical protein BP01DRAFT_338427 [Aspergillus saccharolyticus JOP 1030-1]PYH46107.1 hypothetical protein BP01DRAFT_338427 [Aspergillus saccharolyticus JOP 1030-1]